MLDTRISRRTVLKGGISVSALALFAATGGCESIIESINNRPTRKSVTSAAAATDLATYEAAVAAMQALPAGDPRSWAAQAQIHDDFCPHGNWSFLPWHRAYLWYFERICRELTGVNDFALPYWNWQADRAIPTPFWSGGLDHSPRSATSSSLAGLSYIGSSVIESILDLTNFEQFASYSSTALRGGVGGGYGEVESQPHNNIHGFVGGTMGGFQSPLDPVFWCHHNMVDCLWDAWNNSRGNLNTSDTAWTQFDLAGMFVDENGDPATITCGLTGLLPLLNYQFDVSPKGTGPIIAQRLSEAELRRGGNIRHRVRRQFQVSDGVTLLPRQATAVRAKADTALLSRMAVGERDSGQAEGGERVLLRIAGVRPPKNDDVYVRVFVNLDDANERTSIQSPHYAGSFGFFSCAALAEACGTDMTPDFYVDVTDTLAELREAGEMSLSETLPFTLVAVPHQTGERDPAPIEIGRIDLVSTPAAVRGT